MKLESVSTTFEQNRDVSEYERGYEAAQRAFEAGKVAIDAAFVYRAPRYPDLRRENNAEHSFMLVGAAAELAHALRPELDLGMVSQFAYAHDLIENVTNDEHTLLYTDDMQLQKELREQAALRALETQLPPYTCLAWLAGTKPKLILRLDLSATSINYCRSLLM